MALKVKAGAFWPPPEVDGGVVRMAALATPRGGEVSFQTLRAVVKTAFHKRRKTLRNSFKHVDGAVDAMESAGVSAKLRPEQVEVDAFVALARAFDELDIDEIIAEPAPDRGVGKAILDKLRKASVKEG